MHPPCHATNSLKSRHLRKNATSVPVPKKVQPQLRLGNSYLSLSAKTRWRGRSGFATFCPMKTLYNRLAGHSVERLAALSDGIFAVAPGFRETRAEEAADS